MPPGPGRSLGPRGHLTEEEKANRPKVTRALLARIASYLKPYWLQFIFVFLAILLSAAVGLLQSVFGCILLVVTNIAVKRIDPESGLF